MNIERKYYQKLKQPIGAYSHAVKHDNVLYLSGLTAFGSSSQGGNIVEQAKEVLKQIRSVLQEENVGFESIIKVTLFVTELEDLSALRQILFDVYGKNLPASSLVQVKGLFSPDLKIEIEAIVALN